MPAGWPPISTTPPLGSTPVPGTCSCTSGARRLTSCWRPSQPRSTGSARRLEKYLHRPCCLRLRKGEHRLAPAIKRETVCHYRAQVQAGGGEVEVVLESVLFHTID